MGRYLDLAKVAIEEYRRTLAECDISDQSDRRVCGILIADIRETAGPDWPEIVSDPVLLEVFAQAIQTRRMREVGEVPAHYTATTICHYCGLVPIFEGAPERVDGCPWCFNRWNDAKLKRTP